MVRRTLRQRTLNAIKIDKREIKFAKAHMAIMKGVLSDIKRRRRR